MHRRRVTFVLDAADTLRNRVIRHVMTSFTTLADLPRATKCHFSNVEGIKGKYIRVERDRRVELGRE